MNKDIFIKDSLLMIKKMDMELSIYQILIYGNKAFGRIMNLFKIRKRNLYGNNLLSF